MPTGFEADTQRILRNISIQLESLATDMTEIRAILETLGGATILLFANKGWISLDDLKHRDEVETS